MADSNIAEVIAKKTDTAQNVNEAGSSKTGHVHLYKIFQDSFASTEAYKTLRTNVLFSGDEYKVIVVTSSEAGEGKTTLSIDLARALSDIKKSVLFIDADMRRSSFCKKYLNLDEHINGFSEFLSGQDTLQNVVYETNVPNLFVLPCGKFPPNPTELLNHAQFNEFIEYLKAKFDYIVIDTPPIGSVIDAAIIAHYADGAIFVFSAGRINARYAKNMRIQLEKSGCSIIGAVINNVEQKRSSYNYYRRYYNHYGGGYYYYSYADGARKRKNKDNYYGYGYVNAETYPDLSDSGNAFGEKKKSGKNRSDDKK